jgi:hypothetical protein
VTDILDGVSGDELQAIFGSQIERVQGVIDANEGYLYWYTFLLSKVNEQ